MIRLEIHFENALGMIRFRGAGAAGVRLLAVSGLGLVQKEFRVTGYAGQAGQDLLSEKDLARTITLSCDFQSDAVHQELSRIMKILYRSGMLTVFSGNQKRSIACRCSDLDEPVYYGKNIVKFVVQFTCDNPYFTDGSPQKIDLLQRKSLLKTTFTLPCKFSQRTSRLVVVNNGDVPSEPVFSIYNSGKSSASSESYGIEIENHTTGQNILLERQTASGEVITVDIPNRKITSSMHGDVTYSISQDTFLSNFALSPGANDIEAVNYNAGEDISVVLRYYNLYTEAV